MEHASTHQERRECNLPNQERSLVERTIQNHLKRIRELALEQVGIRADQTPDKRQPALHLSSNRDDLDPDG